MVQRYLEVTQWVPQVQQADLVKAVWAGLGEELRDLRSAGGEEWAEEEAIHLHSAIQRLLSSLLIQAHCQVEGGGEARES